MKNLKYFVWGSVFSMLFLCFAIGCKQESNLRAYQSNYDTIPGPCGRMVDTLSPVPSKSHARVAAVPFEDRPGFTETIIISHRLFVALGSNVQKATEWAYGLEEQSIATFKFAGIKKLHGDIIIWQTAEQDIVGPIADINTQIVQFMKKVPSYSSNVIVYADLGGGSGVAEGMRMLSLQNRSHIVVRLPTTYLPFPYFSDAVSTLCHEDGHILGSQHSFHCSWPGGPEDYTGQYAFPSIFGLCGVDNHPMPLSISMLPDHPSIMSYWRCVDPKIKKMTSLMRFSDKEIDAMNYGLSLASNLVAATPAGTSKDLDMNTWTQSNYTSSGSTGWRFATANNVNLSDWASIQITVTGSGSGQVLGSCGIGTTPKGNQVDFKVTGPGTYNIPLTSYNATAANYFQVRPVIKGYVISSAKLIAK